MDIGRYVFEVLICPNESGRIKTDYNTGLEVWLCEFNRQFNISSRLKGTLIRYDPNHDQAYSNYIL